jgi:hypothetical protein
MEAEQRRAAKEQMIALMQAGHRWQEAAAQAGIQSVVRPPIGCCARCGAVGKPLSRMEDTGTLPNCAQPSGTGWKPTATRRPALQAVWCRRLSRNGSASRSVSAI